MSKTVNIRNKKATFKFEIVATYTAGMQLVGTEVKSIKDGKATIEEAFCRMKKGELWIFNMHVSEYKYGNINNHEDTRPRKLLLKKKELNQIQKKIYEKGFTIVPLRVFISERGFIKIDIALGKGKKLHDKRESLKQKDNKRQLDRIKKSWR